MPANVSGMCACSIETARRLEIHGNAVFAKVSFDGATDRAPDGAPNGAANGAIDGASDGAPASN